MTKHYTDAERRAVYEESMRRLRDDPPARPEPTPKPREVRLPSFEDDIAKWKREAEEASAAREANRMAMRRESREMRTPERAAIDVLNAEVAALRRDHNALAEAGNEQARALIEFSDVVSTKLHALAALADRLDRTLADAKTAREGEATSLRNQLDLVARQNEWLSEQLRVAERQADVATGRRESERTREAVQRVASIIKLK